MKRAVGEETFRRLSAPVDDESLESARCLFLLLFMLRGIPFVDIAYMRRCDMHGNVIAYRRRKTGAWLTVRVEPEAMELIRRLKNPDESSPYLLSLIHISEPTRQAEISYAVFCLKKKKKRKKNTDVS